MEENKASNQKILIIVSAVILFIIILLVAIITFIGKQATLVGNPPGGGVVTGVTVTPIPLGSEETEQASQTVRSLPFTVSPNVPRELFLSIQDYSQNGAVTAEVTYEGDGFQVVLTPLTHPGISEVGREESMRPYPPIYRYVPEDFERIAVVDGKELFISKTGAADFDSASSEARLRSLARMNPRIEENFGETTEYYVYQKYGDGISEYLSIFTENPGDVPSYNQNLIIRYSISEPNGYSNWSTYKQWLKKVLESLQSRNN